MQNTMISPQQQEVLSHNMEKNDHEYDDYLQVLDAGEHMFGMFVSDDEDLDAYLKEVEPLNMSFTEDIEDVIWRSLVPQQQQQQVVTTDDCFCESLDKLHIRGNGSGEAPGRNDDVTTDDDSANGTGRLTPTQIEDDDHDVMSE